MRVLQTVPESPVHFVGRSQLPTQLFDRVAMLPSQKGPVCPLFDLPGAIAHSSLGYAPEQEQIFVRLS